MRLNVVALALAIGIGWALGLLVMGLLNLAYPPYGQAMLDMMASVYPGYHATGTTGDLLVGVAYALLDGVVCGAILALLYNAFTPRRQP